MTTVRQKHKTKKGKSLIFQLSRKNVEAAFVEKQLPRTILEEQLQVPRK